MATIRFEIEVEYDGTEEGYLAIYRGFSSIGAEVIDEEEV